MSSCLGLYIENNLIKYAKVTKERDMVKVDSFGIKFYDRIGDAINQIVSETFSYKVPISINLSEETYQYFYFFNLLNKNDLKKAIETEFDSYCYEKGYNRNALETRYALVPDMENKEKIKAIYISSNKAEINRKLQDLEGQNVSYIIPLAMAIPNIADIKSKENALIVNIEEKTAITTILDENIYSIDILQEGMETILSNINEKENSYAKSYEICKNTTIYTMEGKELQEEENLYLEDIMPTLYNIVQKVKNHVDNSLSRIDKIYITGAGCVINNIDLYFQEYFPSVKCEILKPYFIPENIKINMKDYIEVNSAIALAMQGIGYGVKNINFKKANLADQLPDWMKLEIGNKKEGQQSKKEKSKKSFNFSFDFKAKWDTTERWLLRTTSAILSFIIIYSVITIYLKVQTDNKITEVEDVKKHTTEQIQLADKDIQSLNNKSTDYQTMTENLKNYSEEVQNQLRTKNVIPLLLTRIMNVIPKGVTITSIENTSGSHIVINAQSDSYDLLGFFKGSLIVEGILSPSTVVSTSGVKQNGLVKIVIEGDLP